MTRFKIGQLVTLRGDTKHHRIELMRQVVGGDMEYLIDEKWYCADELEIAFPSNPQAFPSSTRGGMQLRDYFAAKAMQSIVAGINDGGEISDAWMEMADSKGMSLVGLVAESAYFYADAMLRERDK